MWVHKEGRVVEYGRGISKESGAVMKDSNRRRK
jgi:hypothetical protein